MTCVCLDMEHCVGLQGYNMTLDKQLACFFWYFPEFPK